MSTIDARLLEIQFLARLDREGKLNVGGGNDEPAERQMIISLLHDGYLNGIDSFKWPGDPADAHRVIMNFEQRHTQQLGYLLSTKKRTSIDVEISHRGRVRLAELNQQLKTGRDRDDSGLLWAKRHLLVDLAIAVLSARQAAPLSVAFLDMNGLTGINSTHGHAAGDDAIRRFFQTAVATLGQRGEVYRNGGDEVVAILPGISESSAAELLHGFVCQLGNDVLKTYEESLRLTASCGGVSTTDPAEDAKALLKRADKVMYKSKKESGKEKVYVGRSSAWAVGESEVTKHTPGDDRA